MKMNNQTAKEPPRQLMAMQKKSNLRFLEISFKQQSQKQPFKNVYEHRYLEEERNKSQ